MHVPPTLELAGSAGLALLGFLALRVPESSAGDADVETVELGALAAACSKSSIPFPAAVKSRRRDHEVVVKPPVVADIAGAQPELLGVLFTPEDVPGLPDGATEGHLRAAVVCSMGPLCLSRHLEDPQTLVLPRISSGEFRYNTKIGTWVLRCEEKRRVGRGYTTISVSRHDHQ